MRPLLLTGMTIASIVTTSQLPLPAACLQRPIQVQVATVLACEQPDKYLQLGAARIPEEELEHMQLSIDEYASQMVHRTPGVVLVVRITREMTVESRGLGDDFWVHLTKMSPWVDVHSIERVWWPTAKDQACDGFATFREMLITASSPCCDTFPEIDIPCLADLNVGRLVPKWAVEKLPSATEGVADE